VNFRGRRATSFNIKPKRQLFLGGMVVGYAVFKLFSYFDKTPVDQASMYESLTANIDVNSHHIIQVADSVDLLQTRTFTAIHDFTISLFNRRVATFQNESYHLFEDLQHGDLRQLLLIAESYQEQIRTIELFQYSLILSACTSGKLPSSAISPPTLQFELTKLNSNLRKSNFSLVMPITDLSSYYFHDLAQCHFNHEIEEITITLSVLIRPTSVTYKLVETIAIPFRRNINNKTQEICSISISHQLIVIETNTDNSIQSKPNVIPIDPATSSHSKLPVLYNVVHRSPRKPLSFLWRRPPIVTVFMPSQTRQMTLRSSVDILWNNTFYRLHSES
jgi:hypothetical protein